MAEPEYINKKKSKIRYEIIKVAGQVFSKFGYKKTTMDDIAEAAQKGKSSLYYYFESKDEIYKIVVLKEAIAFRKTMIDAIKEEENPRNKIKTYILTRMNILNIYSNFHKALKNDKQQQINFIKRLNILYDKEEIRLFRNILQEGVDKNYFEIADLELASVSIVMSIKGIESILFRSDDPKEFTSKIDSLINMILYGVVKR